MKKSIITIVSIVLLALPAFCMAEVKKIPDQDLKKVKGQSGFSANPVTDVIKNHTDSISGNTITQNMNDQKIISGVSKSFDVLVSDRTGTWERSGNTRTENGITFIDETIKTNGIKYENIRIAGTDQNAPSFGDIEIGETIIEIKGRVKVTLLP